MPASRSAITESAVSQTRRLACLDPPALLVVDREGVEARERALEDGVVALVAEGMEGGDRPDPGRLDPSPGAVALLTRDHPLLGRPKRPSPYGPDRPAVVGTARTVEQEEGPAPGVGRRRGSGQRRPAQPSSERERDGLP